MTKVWKILSLVDTKSNACWSFFKTFLTFGPQRGTPFCCWESGSTGSCFGGVVTSEGDGFPGVPAIPLLKMYPKDTLLKIRIVTVLFFTTF